MTLLRGRANAAADKLARNNALVILGQQIGETGAAIRSGRRAGRRLARMGAAVGRTRLDGSLLRDAEATLATLRNRQVAMTAAEEALDELTSTPARIEDRLGQASFGPATRPTATTVPARLRPLSIT
jgi:hypothetical protein